MSQSSTDRDALDQEMRNIIEEARVVLPGLQALFGFQTIAVFNERFVQVPEYAKDCHLIGLGMVVVAIAMVMTPAVYHRMVGRDYVTQYMIDVSSNLIVGALLPLAVGLGLDIFTVILTATDQPRWSLAGAIAAFVILIGLWFVFPLRERRRRRGAQPSRSRGNKAEQPQRSR